MSLLRPFALWGLLIVPLILILYFFKNGQRKYTVSSTLLWLNVQEELQPEKAFRKLKKSLLILLQVLAAIACVLAVCNPYISAKKNINKYCIVIDNSLSMAAEDEGVTRLSEAKRDAASLVKNSTEGSEFSVYELSDKLVPLANNSDNRAEVVKLIEAVGQSYAAVDYSKLPSSSPSTEEKESVVLFTDGYEGNDAISVYNYGSSFDNCGIITLSLDDEARVLCRVKNYSSNALQKTVGIYADNELCKNETVSIPANSCKDIVFTGISAKATGIKAVVEPHDSFSVDDTRYTVVAEQTAKKVLLYGENSMFTEKVFKAMPNVELYKENTADNETPSGYDLYVMNGKLPTSLPTDGQLLLINPPENELFTYGDETEISHITSHSTDNFKLTDSLDFAVNKVKKINLPTWSDAIVESTETPLIFAGSYGKQKITVIGFSLNSSDLPLKKDFPILVYDMLNYFFPDSYGTGVNIGVGDKAEFNISPLAESVNVIDPSGDTVSLAPPFPALEYDTDTAPGIYYLEQKINSSSVYKAFSINIADSEDLYFNNSVQNNVANSQAFKSVFNYDLSNIFIVLALMLLIAELVLFLHKRNKSASLKNIVLRAMTLIILLMSVLDIRLGMPSKGVTTVFVLDTSDSMSAYVDDELSFVNQAVKNKKSDDYVAAVVVGNTAEILSATNKETEEYNINQIPMGYGSNLQSGIETAYSLFKKGTGKRIVLLTDGCENIGSVMSVLADDEVELKVKSFGEDELAEVQLSDIKVPEYITKGGADNKVNAEVMLTSTIAETVTLKLYVNDVCAYEDKVEVGVGDNRFVIPCQINAEGNIKFKALIQPATDTYYQNNSIYAHSYTDSEPKVLLLEYNDSGKQLEALLNSGGISVSKLDISAAPKSIDKLNEYDAVVMADCAYYDMSSDFIKALESYVKSSAGGLVVTGGENSFAPGGYNDTELENILPVNMEMSDTDKNKSTAMVMVVDRSGSMGSGSYGVSKLELVKEAMVRSVESLEDDDSVGILSFDDDMKWVISPEKIGSDTTDIENKIYSINEGGGTSILPALEEAVNKLADYSADSKHIVLMTDGQGETSGYDSVIQKAIKNNITISTIAVGNDSATELLENIADSADGRYYYTDEFTDLPRIFERETKLSDKTYINNESFYPIADETDDILAGIDAIPQLDGYICTDKKTAATSVLSHENGDPVVAVWQYGLGHTAVFTADIQNQCGNWLSTDEGCAIIKNLVSSVLRSRSSGSFDTELREENGNRILSVTAKSDKVNEVQGTVEGNEFEQNLNFTQVSAGCFEAELNTYEAGNYVVNIQGSSEDGEEIYSRVLSIPYRAEYDIYNLTGGEALLTRLEAVGEGINTGDEVFTDYTKPVYDKLSIKPYLVTLAGVLLYLDLLLRRFKGKHKKQYDKAENEASSTDNKPANAGSEVKPEEEAVTNTTELLLKNKRNRQK
jgi:Mg-chelatase subunit ChlD